MALENVKKHRWMLCGTVYLAAPSDNPEAEYRFEIPLNVMVESEHNYINAHRLGVAQQALQMRAFEKLNKPDAVVQDVVLHSSSYLGHMTEKQWTFQPPIDVAQSGPLATN